MIKLALLGYGKMGKMIDALSENEGCKVHFIHKGNEVLNQELLQQCDVAIDFSIPSAALINITTCIKLGIPVVSGTTGWLDQLPQVQQDLKRFPASTFLYGSNFSIGANIFFALNIYLAKLMNNQAYNLSIDEIHHTTKLDAPSGTAISLAKDIIKHSTKTEWVNQPTKEALKIPIISHREPDVKGTHTVTYSNLIDDITIEHKAHTREGFALGAIKAAKWLIGRKGYYTVQEYIEHEFLTH